MKIAIITMAECFTSRNQTKPGWADLLCVRKRKVSAKELRVWSFQNASKPSIHAVAISLSELSSSRDPVEEENSNLVSNLSVDLGYHNLNSLSSQIAIRKIARNKKHKNSRKQTATRSKSCYSLFAEPYA